MQGNRAQQAAQAALAAVGGGLCHRAPPGGPPVHGSPHIAIVLLPISTAYSPFETGLFTPPRDNTLVRLNERSFRASQQRSETMDTLTQINRLLRHLDATAVALTDAQHPSVDVHL